MECQGCGAGVEADMQKNENLTYMRFLAKVRSNVDSCERIMGRKLTDQEYLQVSRMAGAIERAKEENRDED